jgi:hypothetical protein
LTAVHTVKSKVEISQNFVAFSEYMNFNRNLTVRNRCMMTKPLEGVVGWVTLRVLKVA